MYENPDLVPTVLDALRRGDFLTLIETLDLDDREDFTIAVPPGSGLNVDTVTLVRYGNTQAVLTINNHDDGTSVTTMAFHAHDNEADAVECHGRKADALRDMAAAAYAAANGPVGKAFMALKNSGALDALMRDLKGDH